MSDKENVVISEELTDGAGIAADGLEENGEIGRAFPIWRILYRNIVWIILVTVIAGAIGTVLGYYRVKRTYTARCSVLLSVSLGTISADSATDISLSKLYMPTVVEIIKSNDVVKSANAIYRERGGTGSIGLGAVSVNSSASLIFSISYTDLSAESAKNKLSAFVDASAKELKENGNKYVPANDFRMTETQHEYIMSSSHNVTGYITASFLLGFVASIAVILLIYVLDNKVKNDVELEELTGVTVLAYIEKIKD